MTLLDSQVKIDIRSKCILFMSSVEAALGSSVREEVLDSKSQAKAGVHAFVPDLSGVVTWIANRFSRFEPLFLADIRVLKTNVITTRDRSRVVWGRPDYEFTTVRGIDDELVINCIRNDAQRRLLGSGVGRFFVNRYQQSQEAARIARDPDYARYHSQTGGVSIGDGNIDDRFFTPLATRVRGHFVEENLVLHDPKGLRKPREERWFDYRGMYIHESRLGINAPLGMVRAFSVGGIMEEEKDRYYEQRHLNDDWLTRIEPQPQDSDTIEW